MKDFKSFSKPEIQTILLGSILAWFLLLLIFLFFFLSVFQCWCWLFLFLFLVFFFFFFFILKLNSWFKVLRYCYFTNIFGFEDFSRISSIHSAKKHILTLKKFELTHFVKSLGWLIKSQLHKHEKYGFLSLFFILYERLFLFLFRRVLQGRLLNLPRRFSLKAHYEFHILVIIWFRVDYSVIILSVKFYFTIHAFINAVFFPKQKCILSWEVMFKVQVCSQWTKINYPI